jgi:ribonuclease P protein component
VKRAYRLRRPEQFQRVRQEGRSINHHLLRLNIAPNRRNTVRCGFVVSKRIGKAVIRNRAKRRVREAVRCMVQHIKRGTDIVFVIRTADVATIDFATLQHAIEQLLHRADAWQEPATHEEPTNTMTTKT